jgi:hypothetical protein
VKEPEFFIDPYVIKQGITLLWAKRSVGKSPVSWAMAAAIARGTSFFGLPCKPGKVLYIDVDSPENLLAARLPKENPPDNVLFLIRPGNLGAPNMRKEVEDQLREAQQEVKPDVVFFNTLRKLHRLDDKDSATPAEVYGFFRDIFPQASHVYVHHSKKTPPDPRHRVDPDETFSGSGHWITKYRDESGLFNLRLEHRKSQGTRKIKPLPLKLHPDGSTLTSPLYDRMLHIYTQMHEHPEEQGKEFDTRVGKELGLSASTIWRARHSVIDGEFPRTRHWMDYRAGEEEDDGDD